MPAGKKRKSRSELLNEQFDLGDGSGFDPEAVGGDDAPVAEDFFDGDDQDEDAIPSKLKKKESKRLATSGKKKDAVLRRRAPLDPTLGEGQYAAEPVSSNEINAKVDSLFSMFDGDGDGGDDDMDFDDEEGEEGGDMVDGNKISNEEDYAEFFEKKLEKRAKRQAATAGAADGGDDELFNQIEELRERQLKVTGAADDDEDSDDDAARAENTLRDITQVLVKGYGQLVQLRVKLEGGVSKAVRLPQYYSKDFFVNGDEKGGALNQAYAQSVEDLWATVEDLLSCTENEGGAKAAKKRHGSLKALYTSISSFHTGAMKDVDACITHWGAKMAGNFNAKHKAINRPLLEQIRGVISGKGRLLAKVQRNRLHEPVFGHPAHFNATKQQRALAIADGDLDSEIFDDSDFLRELIHRSGALAAKLQESVDNLKQELNGGADAPKLKQGFHTKTKGKAINYEPRPKLVGFMVPEPFPEGSAHETLFSSLFQ